MSLAEGVQGRITYKAYASGAMASNAQAVSSSDLGVSGGQVLRRVSSSLKLGKDTYQANEIRSDRQVTGGLVSRNTLISAHAAKLSQLRQQ